MIANQTKSTRILNYSLPMLTPNAHFNYPFTDILQTM